MLYASPEAWLAAPQKRVLLFGMSGLGKTRVASLLRQAGGWFHYSVDYRIGTRYMGEFIADNFKREAMKVPLLRDLLMTDSVHISSNITFHNLAPLSTYLGKPGDPAAGGIPFEDYIKRQRQHRDAEIRALEDTAHFAERASELYGYAHFVADTGGSICEVLDPHDPADPLMSKLAATALPIWIRGTEAHEDALVARFVHDPKPMYYPEDLLRQLWDDHLAETGLAPEAVDPDAFVTAGFRRLVRHRAPRYAAMAEHHGVTVEASEVEALTSAADFERLVALAIRRRLSQPPARAI